MAELNKKDPGLEQHPTTSFFVNMLKSIVEFLTYFIVGKK